MSQVFFIIDIAREEHKKAFAFIVTKEIIIGKREPRVEVIASGKTLLTDRMKQKIAIVLSPVVPFCETVTGI